MKRLCIVVPCLNEEAVLPETNRRLSDLLKGMTERKKIAAESGIVYVDDGSTDRTWSIIEDLHAADGRVGGVCLAHNAGHQNALVAGMETTLERYDLFVSIDADLQDDPSVIEQMVDLHNTEQKEIVYGVRRQRREDTFFKRTTAKLFYRLMQRLGAKTVYNHADYRLMSRRAVEELLRYDERNLFLRGIVPMLGYDTAEVYYDRVSRFAGESKYPLSKMLNFAIDGITSFSVKPVRMVLALGVAFVFIALLILLYVLHSWMNKTAVPGWASLIVSMWFIGGCILISLGIIGEYVGKIYIETKHRPRYHVKTILSCLAMLFAFSVSLPAQQRERYEFYKNFPVYADSIIAHLDYPLAWGNSQTKNFKKWKRQARQKVLECMGTSPNPSKGGGLKTSPNPSKGGGLKTSPNPSEGGGLKTSPNPSKGGGLKTSPNPSEGGRLSYLQALKTYKVDIDRGWYHIPALLMVPEGDGPFPAVNLLHDHGAHLFIGKEKMIRPVDDVEEVLQDADQWVEKLYGGQYLDNYLCSKGYVVLAADAPMWGERGRAEGADRSQYDVVAGNMRMYGLNLCAQMTYDDIATTRFLASLPVVDKERIGCVGFSMGGYRSWMLSALSDEIRAAAAVCWMVTTDVQMTWRYGRKENGGFANSIPLLRQYMDYPHIASIACPKPMLFISGRQDKLFPVEGVERAFSIMHDVWRSQKADDMLQTELWDMPHECNKEVQERILHFLDEHLSMKD